jgi:hypothetical protein
MSIGTAIEKLTSILNCTMSFAGSTTLFRMENSPLRPLAPPALRTEPPSSAIANTCASSGRTTAAAQPGQRPIFQYGSIERPSPACSRFHQITETKKMKGHQHMTLLRCKVDDGHDRIILRGSRQDVVNALFEIKAEFECDNDCTITLQNDGMTVVIKDDEIDYLSTIIYTMKEENQ